MNKDDDLERSLRQYRPVGPPAELRDRVVAASGRSADAFARHSIAQWLPSAAALLLAALFYGLGANARRDVAAAAAAIEADRQRRLTELTLVLGDDALARDVAERLLDADEQMVRGDVEQNPGSVIRE